MWGKEQITYNEREWIPYGCNHAPSTPGRWWEGRRCHTRTVRSSGFDPNMTGRCMLQPNTLSDTSSRHLCKNWSTQLPFSRNVLHCTRLAICNCIPTSNYSELNVSSQGCMWWPKMRQKCSAHVYPGLLVARSPSMCLWEVKVKDRCINRYIGNIKHVDTCKYHEQGTQTSQEFQVHHHGLTPFER